MYQLTVFDVLCQNKPLPSKVKLLSLFSGIGAFEKALDNIGIGYELVGYCEIDKYASKSYSAIHGVSEDMNIGDITKVDEKALPKDIALLTYGFPCQDISLAGKQKGLFNEDGTKTRSGLFFDALRIIEETKPRVAIAENVKNLMGKKFKEQFQIVLASLQEAGYNNYYQVLNAKDYGIPQNRERVFIVSIRKDIDNGSFEFPKGFPLEKRLKDVLEETVDEKYYLSDKMIEYIASDNEKFQTPREAFVNKPIASTLTTKEGISRCSQSNYIADGLPDDYDLKKHNDPIRIGGLYDTETSKHQIGSIWDKDAISPTLDTMQGGNRQPLITVDENSIKVRVANKRGYDEAFEGDSINLEQPSSTTRRGRVDKSVAQTLNTMPLQAVVEPMAYDEQNQYIRKDGCVGTITTDGSSPKHNNRIIIGGMQKNQAVKTDGVCTCLTSSMGTGGGYVPMHNYTKDLRIRKLTPKECFRLMGFDDADFHKAELVNSNTQLYKQAGNSIVVDVLEYLLKALFENL